MFNFQFIRAIPSQLAPSIWLQTSKFHNISSLSLVSGNSKSFLLSNVKSKSESVISNGQQVRPHSKYKENFSAWKTINKFGFEKRISSYNGKCMLWRRFLKGRHSLASFQQLLPPEYHGRVLPDHQKHLTKPFPDKKRKVKLIRESF